MTDSSPSTPRPLDADERRVLGVLIEKAKTTPDQYPLSLAAVVTAANQKSNRDPVMHLDEESASRALARLRQCGAVAEVYGSGKIPRYRHLAYEWLGVNKEQLSILGELLLRGAQSEGDLRGRASRMDPIPDLDALRSHLDPLADRGLVVWLAPPGRGRMLTHGLLPPETLEKVRSRLGLAAAAEAAGKPALAPAGGGVSTPDRGLEPIAERADSPPVERARAESPERVDATLAARVGRLEEELERLRERLAAVERGCDKP
jgi:uncharacterized protein YceH (UPF0502 family)